MLKNPQIIDRDSLFKIRTGDALFVKSADGIMSKIIRFFSGSSFVHSAVAVRIESGLYIVESKYSSSYAYQLTPIDWWLARHGHEQLYVGKMPDEHCTKNTRKDIRNIVMDERESLRPYEIFWVMAVYVLQVWLGKCRPQFKKLFKGRRPMICSTLVQEAWERAGVIPFGEYMTPAMLANRLGGEHALIPLDAHSGSGHNKYGRASNEGRYQYPKMA
ncbi:MAG: hypothetical protein KJP04_01650 [Arenicella sp.]|nr:hypothetical protein [Arenicella sp.]NND81836.1 hypothetical protein [Gammaproteobacteria bacterium]